MARGLLAFLVWVFTSWLFGHQEARGISVLDQRSDLSPVRFLYIDRLWAHPHTSGTGFWVEAPSSFHYYTLTPRSSTEWSFQGPFEAPFPVSWARDPQRGLYLGVTLESDVLLSRDGRSWEKVAQSSAVIGSVFCDQFCRLGHCDEWDVRTCEEDRKSIAEGLRVRLAALAYWGGQFFGVIAPIDNYPLSPVLIASSRDGVRWQFLSYIERGDLLDLDRGNEVFDYCAAPRLIPGTDTLVLLCNVHNRGQRAARSVGNSSLFVSRNGGRSWTRVYVGTNGPEGKNRPTLWKAVFVRDRFLAIGNDGYAYLSLNGADWIRIPVLPGLAFRDMVYANGLYLAVGENGVLATSKDGLRWEHRQMASGSLLSVAFSGGVFLVTEEGGRLHLSRDAVNWNTFTPWEIRGAPSPIELKDVAKGDPGYVAVAESGEIVFSADGRSWSVVHRSGIPLNVVRWARGAFIAAGKERILYSQDGRIWRTVFSEYGLDIRSAVWGPRGWVAYGERKGRYAPWVFTSRDGLGWESRDAEEAGVYLINPLDNNRPDFPSYSFHLASHGEGYLAAWSTVVDAGRRGRLAVFKSENGRSWQAVELNEDCREPPVDVHFSGHRFLILGWWGIVTALFPPQRDLLSQGYRCVPIQSTNIGGKYFGADAGLGNCCPFFSRIVGSDSTSEYAILSFTGSLFLSRNLQEWTGVVSGDFNSMTLTSQGSLVLVGRDIAIADWRRLFARLQDHSRP